VPAAKVRQKSNEVYQKEVNQNATPNEVIQG
jgi:hypothetical protein